MQLKIIDFERKGNVVRFYLGADDCEDYWGDDWNDAPYDCNAGTVYHDYVVGVKDVAFPFDDMVLEPSDGILNCGYSKEDMKKRNTPCIIVVPHDVLDGRYWMDQFHHWVGSDHIHKFYFGDEMSLS